MSIVRKLGFQINWNVNNKPFLKANENADSFKNKMKGIGTTLEKNKVKLGAGFATMSGIIGLTTKKAGDFQLQMKTVQAVSGATNEELAQLTDEAKRLSLATKFDPTEIAQGQQFLAQAGFDVVESIKALPSVLNLSAGQLLNLGQTADITSNILSGFSLEAEDMTRVVDTLTATANRSNVNVVQLGESMKFAAPIAQSLGISIEETATAIGFMGDVGIQGGMAGTSLRGSLTKLLKPSNEASKIMNSLGINLLDNQGNMLGLADIVRQFEKGMEGLNETQKAQALATILGQESVTGFMALLSRGSEEIRNFTNETKGMAGVTEKVAKAKIDTFNGSMEILKGSIGLAFIELGEKFAPAIKLVGKGITKLVNVFIKLPEPIQTGIAIVIGLSTALLGIATAIGFLIGPITAFAGLFTTGGILFGAMTWLKITFALLPDLLIGFASTITTTVIPTIWAFSSALLANPITWIVIGIASLIAGIILLVKNWDLVTQSVVNFGLKVKEFLSPAFDFVKEKFYSIVNFFKNFNLWEIISNNMIAGFNLVIQSVINFGLKIKEFLSPAFDFVKGKFYGIVNFFEDFNLGEIISNSITSGFDLVTSTMDKFAQKIRDFLPFSPAKTGPLSDIDKTGQGLTDTVVGSINQNAPKLERSLEDTGNNISNVKGGGVNVTIGEININTGNNIDDIVNETTESFRTKLRKELEIIFSSSAEAVGG